MIEQHYTDEALLSLLDARGSDTLLGDPHLAACGTCADALESYRDIAGLLNEKEVWDEEDAVYESAPVAGTLLRIRAFADATAREDAEAVQLVNALLELPSEWWAEEVRNDDRYHTAGVVRRLVAVAYEAVDVVPAQAETLTAIAIDLVELLDQHVYSMDTIQLLRGLAWRERAQALQYAGRLDEAFRAIEKAAVTLESCPSAVVESARTQLVRSIMLWRSEKLDEAVRSVRDARTVFEAFELTERARAARWMEANILESRGDYRGALEMFRTIEGEMKDARPTELAIIMANIGACYREMRQFDRALPQFEFALSIQQETGNGPETVRIRWNIADTLLAAGKVAEAGKRLRTVRAEFQSFGMVRDAALVDLSLAEAALAESRFAEAEQLCRSVITHFETVEKSNNSNAIAALMYLREAVEQRKANAAVAEAVRKYIGRLPKQPNLLFAPPPLE